jgi:FdhD protein
MKHGAATDLDGGVVETPILCYRDGVCTSAEDAIAVEEPLEIQLRCAGEAEFRSVSTTMRTPGHDGELAAGFLFNEAVIGSIGDIRSIESWGPFRPEPRVQNICRVDLGREKVELDRLERHFYTNSSCGVCGRASLRALLECAGAPLPHDSPPVAASVLLHLPVRLREEQGAFGATGGVHATGLFGGDGELRLLREDVGRHNAMDKVAGRLLLDRLLPASGCVLVASGRLSFELVQKAVMMGVPVLCGVGAPSSIAAELARKTGLTLVGFLREGRFNVYSGEGRVAFDS